MQLAADGRAADVVVLFNYQYVQAALGKVGGIGQAVVAGAYDDGIVAILHACGFCYRAIGGWIGRSCQHRTWALDWAGPIGDNKGIETDTTQA